MPDGLTLKDLLGEDDAENYLWTPRELGELDTSSLKILMDQDVLNQHIKDNDPDEWDLRTFMIEWITR